MFLRLARTSPRRILLAAILVSLVLLGFFRATDEQDRFNREAWELQREEDLKQILSHLARLSETRTSIQEWCRRIVNSLAWNEDPSAFIRAFPGGSPQLYLFSGIGKRISHPALTKGMVSISERAMKALFKMGENAGTSLGRSEQSVLRSLFGSPEAGFAIARNPGKLVDPGTMGKSTLAGVFPFRGHGHRRRFLAVIMESDPRSIPERIRRASERISKLAGPDYAFGCIDHGREFPDQTTGPSSLTGKIRNALLARRIEPAFRVGERLFRTTMVENRFTLFGTCLLPSPKTSLTTSRVFRISLWIALMILLLALLARADRAFVPIRLQVVFLFSLAALGSILTLLGFARSYQETLQWNLVRERIHDSSRILEKLDADFLPSMQTRIRQYRKLLAGCRAVPRDLPDTLERLARLRKFGNRIGAFLVASGSEFLFRHHPPGDYSLKELLGAESEKMVVGIGQAAIERVNSPVEQKVRVTGLKRSQSLLNLGKILAMELGWQFLRFRGTLGTYNIANKTSLLFFDVAFDESGKALASLLITHENRCLEKSFLRSRARLLRANSFPASFPFRIFALSREREPKNREIFPGVRREKNVTQLNDLMLVTGSVVSRVGSFRGRDAIITGVPGKTLPDHNLFLVTPMEPIVESTREMGRGFLAFAFLIMLFAATLGILFSGLLLDPIGKLSSGIGDLVELRFSRTVQIGTGDVMEEIGTGINAIAEEWMQLAQARAVQERLFPEEPLVSGGWRCRGWNRSSSTIGGEIFDFFPLPGNRMGILLVGIPGQKIGSALLLAMVKMAFRLLSRPETALPAEVIKTAGSSFPTISEGLCAGDCFFGILSTPTGFLNFSCTGRILFGEPTQEGHGWSPDSGRMVIPPGSVLALGTPGLLRPPGQAAGNLTPDMLFGLLAQTLRESETDPGGVLFRKLDGRYGCEEPWTSQTLVVLDRPGGTG